MNQGRELAFFEPFFSSEPCELAYGFDVFSRIVFARWRPSIYYVFYTYGFVFSSVGFEEAESSSEAPVHRLELHEQPVRLFCSLPLPSSTSNPLDIKGVAVSYASCHDFLFYQELENSFRTRIARIDTNLSLFQMTDHRSALFKNKGCLF